MSRTHRTLLLHGLAAALLSACGGSTPAPLDGAVPDAPDAPPAAQVRRALIIGIDGLRGDALLAADTPRIDQLVARGAYSYRAGTQLQTQTISGPGWASVLTGVDSDKHRVRGNDQFPARDRDYPSFFLRATLAGLTTAAVVHWFPIQTDVFASEKSSTLGRVRLDDAVVTSDMAEILATREFALHFVHLDDVDHAGHAGRFLLDDAGYMGAIERKDAEVGRLVDAIESRPGRAREEWLIVLVTDHGGDENGHGALNEANRTIPLILAGDGVQPGELVAAAGGRLSHMDVHPSVMTYLGLPPLPDWNLDGHVVGLRK